MNKNLELVKKWIQDKNSVGFDELLKAQDDLKKSSDENRNLDRLLEKSVRSAINASCLSDSSTSAKLYIEKCRESVEEAEKTLSNYLKKEWILNIGSIQIVFRKKLTEK
jgi:hypothetical protein